MTLVIRLWVMSYMQANEDTYPPLIEGRPEKLDRLTSNQKNETFAEYIVRMRNEGEYGDNESVSATVSGFASRHRK